MKENLIKNNIQVHYNQLTNQTHKIIISMIIILQSTTQKVNLSSLISSRSLFLKKTIKSIILNKAKSYIRKIIHSQILFKIIQIILIYFAHTIQIFSKLILLEIKEDKVLNFIKNRITKNQF